MSRDKRRYPISEEPFHTEVLPIIPDSCGERDVRSKYLITRYFAGYCIYCEPAAPGEIYPRSTGIGMGGSKRGLWAKILLKLAKRSGIGCKEVIIDSTTMEAYRQGEG
jgi:hypothetical protein